MLFEATQWKTLAQGVPEIHNPSPLESPCSTWNMMAG